MNKNTPLNQKNAWFINFFSNHQIGMVKVSDEQQVHCQDFLRKMIFKLSENQKQSIQSVLVSLSTKRTSFLDYLQNLSQDLFEQHPEMRNDLNLIPIKKQ